MPHLHESTPNCIWMTRAEHQEAHGFIEAPKIKRSHRDNPKAWAAAEAKLLATDLDWEKWLARVESESGRDIPNLDSAYIAHRNGVTASDYALEVVARAAEMAGV
jgi:hypothetical protein